MYWMNWELLMMLEDTLLLVRLFMVMLVLGVYR